MNDISLSSINSVLKSRNRIQYDGYGIYLCTGDVNHKDYLLLMKQILRYISVIDKFEASKNKFGIDFRKAIQLIDNFELLHGHTRNQRFNDMLKIEKEIRNWFEVFDKDYYLTLYVKLFDKKNCYYSKYKHYYFYSDEVNIGFGVFTVWHGLYNYFTNYTKCIISYNIVSKSNPGLNYLIENHLNNHKVQSSKDQNASKNRELMIYKICNNQNSKSDKIKVKKKEEEKKLELDLNSEPDFHSEPNTSLRLSLDLQSKSSENSDSEEMLGLVKYPEKPYLLKLDEFEEKSEISLIFSEVNLLNQKDIDLIKSYVSIYQDVILSIYPRDHELEGKHDSLEDASDELEKNQTPYEITIKDYAKVSGKWIRNVLVNLGLQKVKEVKISKFDSNWIDSIIADCICELACIRVLSLSDTEQEISENTIKHLESLKSLESLSVAKCNYKSDIFTVSNKVFKRLKVLGMKDDSELTNEKIRDIVNNPELILIRS